MKVMESVNPVKYRKLLFFLAAINADEYITVRYRSSFRFILIAHAISVKRKIYLKNPTFIAATKML